MDRQVTAAARRTRGIPRRYRAATGLVATLTIIVVAAAAVSAVSDDSGTCNRNNAEAPSIAFGVPSGKAVRTVIPRLGIAPELDAIIEPVDVVVFTGPHHAVPIFPAIQAEGEPVPEPALPLHNVVCVRSPSGEEMYYTDVDISELRLDGLMVDRRDG